MRDDELYHFGILGMKWGVRRYQNEDGSWTDRGKSRRRSNEPHKHKRLTKEQKEKLKKIGKAAAIGAGVTGAVVGGAILAKKFGPGVVKSLRGANTDYETAIKRKGILQEAIDYATKQRDNTPKGSLAWNSLNDDIKQLRKQSFEYTKTSARTGIPRIAKNVFRKPFKIAAYGVSPEGAKERGEMLKESYKKYIRTGMGIGGVAASGAMAYAGAAAMDKLFDEQRDRRIARRNGARYVKRPMNARAADYMFPKPH